MQQKYHLKDVIVGKIYFLLVRIKIKHMEIAIIKRETTGSGKRIETFTIFCINLCIFTWYSLWDDLWKLCRAQHIQWEWDNCQIRDHGRSTCAWRKHSNQSFSRRVRINADHEGHQQKVFRSLLRKSYISKMYICDPVPPTIKGGSN